MISTMVDVEPFRIVRLGTPQINLITVVHDQPDIFIAEIDMMTKRDYPTIAHYEPDEIMIWPKMTPEGSLGQATVVRMPTRTRGWHVLVGGGEIYTIRVAAWKRKDTFLGTSA